MSSKSLKISTKSYVELLKIKAQLTAQDGEIRTFDDAQKELIREYLGPYYVVDTTEDNAKKIIENQRELTPWLEYFQGESQSGEEGLVGVYYIVHREDASFPRDKWLQQKEK